MRSGTNASIGSFTAAKSLNDLFPLVYRLGSRNRWDRARTSRPKPPEATPKDDRALSVQSAPEILNYSKGSLCNNASDMSAGILVFTNMSEAQ